MPVLSIIVTSYNIAPYIAACLDTVTGQTLEDIEIIVVDDGSRDGSADIIRSCAARDARIRTILFETNTPGGVATAANAGLDAATGDYIGFMDGDDLCEPAMFETLLAAAQRHDADLAMCRYLEQQEPDGTRSEPAEVRRWLDYPSETCLTLDTGTRQKVLRFIAVPWRKIYRRDLLERKAIRFPVGDFFYEDNPFHWFSVISANKIVLVPEVLCYHRVGRPGQTMKTADERLFRIFRHFFTIRDWLDAEGVRDLYRIDLLGWAVSQMEWIGRRTPPELCRQLFDTTAPILADYTQAEVDEMIRGFNKGATAAALTGPLLLGDAEAFAAAVNRTAVTTPESGKASVGKTPVKKGQPPKRASLFQEGMHHLRNHGVLSTAALTTRYLLRGPRSKAVAELDLEETAQAKTAQAKTRVAGNNDILFVLSVLDRKLQRLDARLANLEAIAQGPRTAAETPGPAEQSLPAMTAVSDHVPDTGTDR